VRSKFHTVFYHSQAVRNAFIKVEGGKIIDIGSRPSVFVTINYGIDRAGRRNGQIKPVSYLANSHLICAIMDFPIHQ